MTELTRIGVDTSKAVFTLYGIDAADRPVLRINLRRGQMAPFFRKLPPAIVAMEACGSSHHWARELATLGHTVRLVPPQYVKPYVKRGKNDRNDAEAICEAAGRPGMHFVPAKTLEQQAEGMVLKARDMLVGQRTALINAVRGHAAELASLPPRAPRKSTRCSLPLNSNPTFRQLPGRCSPCSASRSTKSTPASRNSTQSSRPCTRPIRSASA
jgi:transposase